MYFYIFKLFWYADVKNIFLKIKKNIILMHFQLKNNYNHTIKHTLNSTSQFNTLFSHAWILN